MRTFFTLCNQVENILPLQYLSQTISEVDRHEGGSFAESSSKPRSVQAGPAKPVGRPHLLSYSEPVAEPGGYTPFRCR